MQIEKGKRYVTRDGVVTGRMRHNDNQAAEFYPFSARDTVLTDGAAPWWTPTGAYFSDGEKHGSDLVAEYVEPADDSEALGYPVEPVPVLAELRRAAPNAYTQAADDALAEVRRAKELWPGNANSAHEQFAVLWEEVDELKVHVWTNQKRRDLGAMRKEAIQVAAMAMRFAAECCDEVTGRK